MLLSVSILLQEGDLIIWYISCHATDYKIQVCPVELFTCFFITLCGFFCRLFFLLACLPVGRDVKRDMPVNLLLSMIGVMTQHNGPPPQSFIYLSSSFASSALSSSTSALTSFASSAFSSIASSEASVSVCSS